MTGCGRRGWAGLLATLVGPGLRPPLALAQASAGVQVEIRSTKETIDRLPASLRLRSDIRPDTSAAAAAMAREVPADRGVPVFLIFTGILAIPFLWQAVLEMIRQQHFGGVVIDTRPSPVSIIHDHAVPPGMVFVVEPGGKVTQYRSQDVTPEFLGKLLHAR
ncbi:hypothetical protein [Paracraurococcus lichenis]|uniref:Uncharacterized protein n=1 Tax=Paracraurococcus lichenis TaxID=3064888 RepID=A0ABT9DZX0_9PROT|nr:hypothetical protein [Paracraurococcus sp. LOR1-02]MDO9709428.1 hypothetical protein [Paracraurococcus sp. LOR1-02]